MNAGLVDQGEHYSNSPLLELPAELRDAIYRSVLKVTKDTISSTTQGHGGDASTVTLTRTPQNPHLHSVLSILFTCRQIQAEASGIFEESNGLLINIPNRKDTFLSLARQSLGDRPTHLRTVVLSVKGPHLILTAIEFLALLPYLVSTTLEIQRNRDPEAFADVIKVVCRDVHAMSMGRPPTSQLRQLSLECRPLRVPKGELERAEDGLVEVMLRKLRFRMVRLFPDALILRAA